MVQRRSTLCAYGRKGNLYIEAPACFYCRSHSIHSRSRISHSNEIEGTLITSWMWRMNIIINQLSKSLNLMLTLYVGAVRKSRSLIASQLRRRPDNEPYSLFALSYAGVISVSDRRSISILCALPRLFRERKRSELRNIAGCFLHCVGLWQRLQIRRDISPSILQSRRRPWRDSRRNDAGLPFVNGSRGWLN